LRTITGIIISEEKKPQEKRGLTNVYGRTTSLAWGKNSKVKLHSKSGEGFKEVADVKERDPLGGEEEGRRQGKASLLMIHTSKPRKKRRKGLKGFGRNTIVFFS